MDFILKLLDLACNYFDKIKIIIMLTCVIGVLYFIYMHADIVIADQDCLRENGNYYQFYYDEIGWNDAKKNCEKTGGHLATVNDETENDIIKNMIGFSAIWLGGVKTEEEWKWITKEEVNYTNWSEGEPNNYAGKENIIVMLPDGSWNDETVMIYYTDGSVGGLSYVCEWEHKVNIIFNLFDSYYTLGF